jgi:O-methyltransferase
MPEMATSKLHHQFPIVGRPYRQRNEARLQRDQAYLERDDARRERDQARKERDCAQEELDSIRAHAQVRPNSCVDDITSNSVAGWVFADSGRITRVTARRDGQIIATTSAFQSRPDVAAAHPSSKYAELSGFELSFDPPQAGGISIVKVFAEKDGVDFLIGEAPTADPFALEEQINQCQYESRNSYPLEIVKLSYVINKDRLLTIDRVREILSISDFRGIHQVSDYVRYMTSCWSQFSFVALSFPSVNRNSAAGKKDFRCKPNSPFEMMSIAHHLYVAKSYGVEGALAEFGCFKGFSSSMLSYACSLLNIDMHVYDSFAGLPASTSSYYQKGDFSGSVEEVKKNIAQFGAINSVVFHEGFFADSLKTEMPPPLLCLWMDVDLYSSAMDVMAAAKMLSPAGAIFSHECSPDDFSGSIPRSDRGGPEGVVPAILSYYSSEGSPPNGLFVAGNTGAFWRASAGIPVLPTNDLQRLLEVIGRH